MVRLPCPTREIILSASSYEELNFYRNGAFAQIVEELKQQPCTLNNDTRLILLDIFTRLQTAKQSELPKILMFTKGGRYKKSILEIMEIGELIHAEWIKTKNVSQAIKNIKSRCSKKVEGYSHLNIGTLEPRILTYYYEEWKKYDEWQKGIEEFESINDPFCKQD